MTTTYVHPRRVLADLLPGATTRDAAVVVAGTLLIGACAQVAIPTPLTPVPFTLQTFAVLLVGASLGTIRGTASTLLYLTAGVSGIPWFADQGHGWGGATFGYVLGFIAAAAVTGLLAERRADRSVLGTITLWAAGTALIYLIGTTWLAYSLSLSPLRAFDLGVVPFLLADAIKCIMAAAILPATWRLLGSDRK